MIRLTLPSTVANRYTGGENELEIDAVSVRQLLRDLESRYPGLGREIERAMALVIDGELHQDPFMESLEGASEVFVLPKIAGGD
jgi:molybdopterin converting factor small subunit